MRGRYSFHSASPSSLFSIGHVGIVTYVGGGHGCRVRRVMVKARGEARHVRVCEGVGGEGEGGSEGGLGGGGGEGGGGEGGGGEGGGGEGEGGGGKGLGGGGEGGGGLRQRG